jgi:hypothetical protein
MYSRYLAQARGVVALAASAALVAVEVRHNHLGDVLALQLQFQAGQFGGAAVPAQDGLDGQQVLGTWETQR